MCSHTMIGPGISVSYVQIQGEMFVTDNSLEIGTRARFINDFCIEIKFYYSDFTWVSCHLKSLGTPLFVHQLVYANIKEDTKA